MLLPATSRSFLVADFFGCCSRAWRCSWRSSCRKVGTGSTDCSLAVFSITKVRLIAKNCKGTVRLKVVVWSPLSLHFASCCCAVASAKNVCLVPVDVAGQQGTFSFAGAVANLRQDLQKCSLLGSLLCVWCGVTQNNTGTPTHVSPHRHTQTQTTLNPRSF